MAIIDHLDSPSSFAVYAAVHSVGLAAAPYRFSPGVTRAYPKRPVAEFASR